MIEWDRFSQSTAQKDGLKVLYQFHSGLEHTFLLVVDSDSAHTIEDLMARTAGRFNTIKYLVSFRGIIERCKQIEEGIFFPEGECILFFYICLNGKMERIASLN